MIELGKKYQTRDGRAARILATDRKSAAFGRTVTGLVESLNGKEEDPNCWYPDGRHEAETLSVYDLIPVPTKHEGWIVVGWQNEDGCYLTNKVIWNTRQEAVEQASHLSGIDQFIAHVTWED